MDKKLTIMREYTHTHTYTHTITYFEEEPIFILNLLNFDFKKDFEEVSCLNFDFKKLKI